MLRFKLILALAGAGILTSCEKEEESSLATTALPGAQEARFNRATDESLLTLAGTVVSATPGALTLDIGTETIAVEMDDWDWYKEGAALKAGDRVSVTGRVDKDLWEQKKIEASSVYVPKLGTTFFASAADEEDLATTVVQVDPVISARGYVTAVEGQEFTIGSLTGPVRVDFSRVAPKPSIKVGDRVFAWGELDLDLQEKAELMARGVVLTTPQTKSGTVSEAKPDTTNTTETKPQSTETTATEPKATEMKPETKRPT